MRGALWLVTTLFAAYTAWVVAEVGYLGFFETLWSTSVGWQVFFDLCIALGLVLGWMWRDSRKRRAIFWPFALATLLLGSLGPLAYLLFRRPAEEST